MNSQVQIFENKEFGNIRVVEKDGQPWWVLKDVCDALGLSNPSMIATRLDDDERAKFNLGRQGEANIISESGLYAVILRSDKPNAQKFRKWITSEVIPSIRRHGAYITEQTLAKMAQDQDYTAQLLDALIKSYGNNAALLNYAERLVPKARYYDVILQCSDAVQTSIIAKDYGMSAIAFNKMLHALEVQYKVGKTWLLYKEHAGKGYTVTKTYYIGDKIASIHTCWTQKGRFWLYDLLGWHGILPASQKIHDN